MSTNGAFSFVIYGHLPYVSNTAIWLAEYAGETLVPLLYSLHRLKDENVEAALTIGLSPALVEQLAKPEFPDSLNDYFDSKIAAAQHDIRLFKENRLSTSPTDEGPGDPHLRYLAEWYATWFERIKKTFNERFEQDLIGAFRQLQDAGIIEIMTGAATDAYLPLLSNEKSVERQVKVAVESYERVFNRVPTSMWLPELGYRPGIENVLADAGIKTFVTESHLLTGGPTVGVAAGEVLGPYNAPQKRFVLPYTGPAPVRDTSTHLPYYVGEQSQTVVVARDNRSTMQVWGAPLGYHGDIDYRARARRSGTSGLRYWRLTGPGADIAELDYYHPDWAAYKVEQHAEHFAHLIGDMIRDYHNETGQFGLIAPAFDMRLFGQWWFEANRWLGQTLQHLANTPEIELVTLTQYITEHPPQSHVNLDEGSWGSGGKHFLLNNPDTRWMWDPIHKAEEQVAQFEPAGAEQEMVFEQAVRELLLLQSSDWPVMISTEQAPHHASHLFQLHHERFNRLMDSLESGAPDVQAAERYRQLDNIFLDETL